MHIQHAYAPERNFAKGREQAQKRPSPHKGKKEKVPTDNYYSRGGGVYIHILRGGSMQDICRKVSNYGKCDCDMFLYICIHLLYGTGGTSSTSFAGVSWVQTEQNVQVHVSLLL